MKYYRLQIDTKADSRETFDKVTEIVGLIPNELENETNFKHWIYEKEESDSEPYYDFINRFSEIVEPKIDVLSALGISSQDISVWYLYAYDQQCNMEFLPKDLKRLGDNGISLCISCWENSDCLEQSTNA